MNPMNPLGMQEIQDDVDNAEVYDGEDIDLEDYGTSPTLLEQARKYGLDVVQQAAKQGASGIFGSYGDILETTGLQDVSRENSRNYEQSEILGRLQQPGYQPSFSELDYLTDDTTVPQTFNLPTSEGISRGIEDVTGIGEAQTGAGRYSGRISRLYGSGLAFGQTNPLPAIVAGAVGQTVEEFGGGPLLQAAGEIATLIATSGKGLPNLQSAEKEIQKRIMQLRDLGYSDQDITLAINAARKNGKASKIASKGSKTEQAFEDATSKSEELINNELIKAFPGLEEGTESLHKAASEAYGEAARTGSSIKIADPIPFTKKVLGIIDELTNTLANNPKVATLLDFLVDAGAAIEKNPTGDTVVNFYKQLNEIGQWVGRDQKDRILRSMKNAIIDTFEGQGPTGKKFAEQFKQANLGVQKAYQAQDVAKLISSAQATDGLDFNKLYKILGKNENKKLLVETMGQKSADNLFQISKVGKDIKDFDKAYKAVKGFDPLRTGLDIATGGGIGYYILKGDYETAAKIAATKGLRSVSAKSIAKLAEKSLTDPKFQSLQLRALHAIKNQSVRTFATVEKELKDYLENEGVDVEL